MDHIGRSIHCGLLQFGMMTAQGSSLSHAVFSTSRRFIRGQMGARDTTPIIFGCIDSDARIPEPGEWTISETAVLDGVYTVCRCVPHPCQVTNAA